MSENLSEKDKLFRTIRRILQGVVVLFVLSFMAAFCAGLMSNL